MYDIDLHPLQKADGDVIVVGHIHVAVECLWKFVSVTIVQSNPSEEFIPLCPLGVGFLFSLLPDVLSDLKSLLL
jgi:hypothetical protein